MPGHKPFDPAAAMRGEPVTTKSGEPVRLLCIDGTGHYPVVGILSPEKGTETAAWTLSGKFYEYGKTDAYDLVMAEPASDEPEPVAYMLNEFLLAHNVVGVVRCGSSERGRLIRWWEATVGLEGEPGHGTGKGTTPFEAIEQAVEAARHSTISQRGKQP